MLSRADRLKVSAEQQRQIAELTARVEALPAEGERLRRSGQRQAASFSQGTHVAEPKKPGRKPGQGLFHHRTAPAPPPLTAPPRAGPLLLRACPVCGGQLVAAGSEDAAITDLPEVRQPQERQLRAAVSRCRTCGRRVGGQHPEVAPDQYGATAHRGGVRVMAAAHVRH